MTAIRQQLYTTAVTSGSVAPSLLFKSALIQALFFALNYSPCFLDDFFATLREYCEEPEMFVFSTTLLCESKSVYGAVTNSI